MSPRWATFALFAVNGAMIGTWVAHIPWLQERLDISKTTIGFALLCMAAGALIAMPLTGQILDRRSSAGVARVAALLFCLLLPLPLIAPNAIAARPSVRAGGRRAPSDAAIRPPAMPPIA